MLVSSFIRCNLSIPSCAWNLERYNCIHKIVKYSMMTTLFVSWTSYCSTKCLTVIFNPRVHSPVSIVKIFGSVILLHKHLITTSKIWNRSTILVRTSTFLLAFGCFQKTNNEFHTVVKNSKRFFFSPKPNQGQWDLWIYRIAKRNARLGTNQFLKITRARPYRTLSRGCQRNKSRWAPCDGEQYREWSISK